MYKIKIVICVETKGVKELDVFLLILNA